MIRRREFITMVGAAVACPVELLAQQSSKIWRVGMLDTVSRELNSANMHAFLRQLRENGYIEGQNVSVEYRWAEGHYDRLPTLAAELVRSRVAVLVTTGGEPSVLAAKAATSSARPPTCTSPMCR